MLRSIVCLVLAGLGASACAVSPASTARIELTADVSPATERDLDAFFASLSDDPDLDALERLGEVHDERLGWLFVDVLRFARPGSTLSYHLVEAWESAVDATVPEGRSAWGATTNHMIAADISAPPNYPRWKREIFELIEPGWAPFFDDAGATIDWRWVSWGGVLIDDRPIAEVGFGCPEGCIPALDDPGLVEANTIDDWLDDDRLVFGIEVDGESVALPKNIMEIHEMINMTLGGRRLGIPYCTLCGSAQAYFTDDPTLDQPLELRTSGLLLRSNKVMYEFHSKSAFDTFTGEAVTGPLREAGVQLEQTSVITTTWEAWKDSHPDTRLIASDGGIGRTYRDNPLGGRDDNGPIFPIGDTDPRLAIQEPIIGVISDSGQPLAFSVAAATEAIRGGQTVTNSGVTLFSDGSGFRAQTKDGSELAAHQAFWFAWSQFHPTTELWLG